MTPIAEAEALLQQRDLSAAAAAFERIAASGQELDQCAGGLWMTHMLAGDFSAAWQQSDALRRRGAPDPHRFWQGESIDGKRLMLRCLHGFGDAVQMLRYLPKLRQRCASVTVEVPPRLLQLAPFFAGMGQVITWGEDAPAQSPSWDVQVEIVELPYLFRTTCQELPIATRYLNVPDAVQTRSRTGARKQIGVIWSTGEWNRTRAIPFDFIQTLTAENGADFWNLQGGPEHEQWNVLPPSPHLHDDPDARDSIEALATLIQQMDLVITADTLAAHLAGALGSTAWVVLQHAADWRWMHARADSPWYPSLRLFRQTHSGDWNSVMSQVYAALADWLEPA